MTTSPDSDIDTLTAITKQTIAETAHGTVSVEDLLRAFGHTSFVPLLILPALVVISPLSGIPGMSTICGIIIMLIAGQRLTGHQQIWLPGWIRRRTLQSTRLNQALTKMLPFTRFVDNHTHKRLTFLFSFPFNCTLPLVCVLLGMIMPALEVIPFSSSLVGVAVALIAVAMLTRDGLFGFFALLPIGLVIWGMIAVFAAV